MKLKLNPKRASLWMFLFLPFLFTKGVLAAEIQCRDLFHPGQIENSFSLRDKSNFLYQVSYYTRAQDDLQVIHLQEVAWKVLTQNVDLSRMVRHFMDQGRTHLFRYVISDALVESARNVDWKVLNENPTHEDYPWAIGLILEKAVVMANELGYSAPTILSNELSIVEIKAVPVLKVRGEYMLRIEHDGNLKMRTDDGEVFLFKWQRPSENSGEQYGKWVRQKNN
jgi:hypothetical protein